jgi:SAM-dependent methyltransferase
VSFRSAARRVALPILGKVQSHRRRNLTDKQRWDAELGSEVGFWRTYLGDLAEDDRTNYRRTDYAWSEEPVYAKVADRLPEGEVSLLDVGAGPMTAVPKVHSGREIRITAFDPLADDYNARLDELGIEPLVRTRRSSGEDLLDHVEESSFDVAHASNALDHAYDPAQAIANMVRAVRPGGFVLLRHEHNEATNEHYLGLHQWNFDVEDGDFIVWRPQTRRNLSRELAGLATSEVFFEGREIVCLLTRR